jgi:hypothetical protein
VGILTIIGKDGKSNIDHNESPLRQAAGFQVAQTFQALSLRS